MLAQCSYCGAEAEVAYNGRLIDLLNSLAAQGWAFGSYADEDVYNLPRDYPYLVCPGCVQELEDENAQSDLAEANSGWFAGGYGPQREGGAK